MKKIFLIFMGIINLFAFNVERELFEKLFSELFAKKTVYVLVSPEAYKYIKYSKILIPVKSCKKADLQFGMYNKNCSKPAFVLNYYTFKNNPEILGAFYWRKGRPQLRLRKKIIKKYNLHITKDFEDYVE